MGKVATTYNIDNEIVLLKEGMQNVAAEIEVQRARSTGNTKTPRMGR